MKKVLRFPRDVRIPSPSSLDYVDGAKRLTVDANKAGGFDGLTTVDLALEKHGECFAASKKEGGKRWKI